MGAFQSARTFPVVISDVTPVARDVMEHFEGQGYQVTGEESITQGWHISISKGGTFKAVMGMQTALNIEIEPIGAAGTSAKASIGIFGKQVIPTAIAWFFFAPIILTQIWGMVQQSKLDDEALQCIERSLELHAGSASGVAVGDGAETASPFCTSCGARLQPSAKFCAECGTKADAAA